MDKQKLFYEIEYHLTNDTAPSLYMNEILERGGLEQYPYTMLSDLCDVMQNPKYHSEGNVWNHTMLVIDEAASRRDKSVNKRVFMWAALLHDIGKTSTTRTIKGRITAYNHEREGSLMAAEFLKYFNMDYESAARVAALVRWHMEPLFLAKKLPFSNIKAMLTEVDLDEIVMLSICDRFGRGGMTKEKMHDEEKGIENFKKECREKATELNI